MKKKCKVVMLPTQKESRLYKGINGLAALSPVGTIDKPTTFDKYDARRSTMSLQHLYLISDDEIKYEDWVYDTKTNIIFPAKRNVDFMSDCKKVIASTDTELRISEDYKIVSGTNHMSKISKPIPTFPEDFIKAYVKANGEISEVLVEYKQLYEDQLEGREFVPRPCGKRLKLRDDNTVIIHLEEEKMYSREDIMNALHKVEIIHNRDYSEIWEGIKENL